MPKKTTIKAYCPACSRVDWHKPVKLHPLWIAATFGLAALVRPYCCACCGNRRLVAGNPPLKQASS